MHLTHRSVKKIMSRILHPETVEKTSTFSEPVFASFLVFRHCLGDGSPWGCPLARFFRLAGIPNARVYTDFFTWGLVLPLGSHQKRPYLWSHKMALPPALRHFQANAYLYPLLFNPEADRSLQKRLSFVLSAIGTNNKGSQISALMVLDSIKRGEIPQGGDLTLEVDPTMFDAAHVNTLLQSLGDTPQSSKP